MKTETVKTDRNNIDTEAIKRAASVLLSGGLVAFPTETVYGLGGSALCSGSAEKIYRAKGRPSDNPLIIHITNAKDAEKYAYTNDIYYKITDKFSPGPITVILPKRENIPYTVTGGLETVAVRIPSHPVARAFIDACGVPIAAPSANLSGSPSPTSALHVQDDLNGRIDMIIDGGDCDIGLESTVVKIKDGKIIILRPGAVTEEQLSSLAPVGRDETMLKKPGADFHPEAPGMKYRHYAPKASVYMVRGAQSDVKEYMKARLAEDSRAGIICYETDRREVKGENVMYLSQSPQAQAHELFAVLRAFDKTGADTIYTVVPARQGVGFAVCNRLVKAAGFKVVRARGSIRVIGLTGQSGAGKSTVAAVFKKLGCAVIDCDKVYSELLYPSSPLMKSLENAFGKSIVKPDGTLDRKTLSQIVFSDKAKLDLLNSVTHGFVLAEVNNRLISAEDNGFKTAVVDAPQLFESGYDAECDIVVGVCADGDIRLARLTKRDGLPKDKIISRMKSQHNEDFFRVYCDVIIENNGDEKDLDAQAAEVLRNLDQ